MHFEEDQFILNKKGKKRLKKGAVPSLFKHRVLPKKRKHRTPISLGKSSLGESSLGESSLGESRAGFPDILVDHTYCAPQLPQIATDTGEGVMTEHERGSDLTSLPDTNVDEGAEEDQPEHGSRTDSEEVKHLKDRVSRFKTKLAMANCELRRVRKENAAIRKKKERQQNSIKKIFAPDQIKSLGRSSTRGCKWSNQTVKNALKIRFAAGATGYQMLLKQHYPLPAIRTLQKKMEFVHFEPGILTEVFEFLKIKVNELKEEERECCLTLDEMAITPSVELHTASGKLHGDVTLPGHTGVANHGLVFMLAGVTSRWKQTVGYHYTSSSTDGTAYKPLILDIVNRAGDIGLHVTAITSDMGSPNRAMWRSFGVTCGFYCDTSNSIPHPYHEGRKLYFLADVPHLIKNLKSALVRGQVINIPADVATKEQLTTTAVSLNPVKDLVDFQDDSTLQIAPKLTKASINPSHFDKMKVSHALHFFSKSASAGVRYLVEAEGRPSSHLTTAWFLDIMNRWFNLMSSRHPVLALSKMKLDEYEHAISFLQDVMKLFRNMKIGPKGDWKPVQTGIILSTKSILDIQSELLDRGHHFVLTSRFTQDCLENLFSSVRLKNPVPTPLEFRYALRMISVGQFLNTSHSGSYQDDEGHFLADFLDCKPIGNAAATVGIPLDNLVDGRESATACMTKAEENSLFYLVGYIVHKVVKSKQVCDDCRPSIISQSVQSAKSKLLSLKEFKKNALCNPSEEVFHLIKQVENVFRSVSDEVLTSSANILSSLKTKAEQSTCTILMPTCHNVKRNVICRYVKLRLSIAAKRIARSRKKAMEASKKGDGHLGSRSQAMRIIITKLK